MKLSTYTLLISATAAVQMRSMVEPTEEPAPADDTLQLECVFEEDKCKAKELEGDQEDTCIEFKKEEECLGANEPKEDDEEKTDEETPEDGEDMPEDPVDASGAEDEEGSEPPVDEETALECEFDAEAKTCAAVDLQEDQEDTCIEFKDEETCLEGNKEEEGAEEKPKEGAAEEGGAEVDGADEDVEEGSDVEEDV